MKKVICIKIGGKPVSDTQVVEDLIGDIGILRNDNTITLVHGGGALVSDLSGKLGIEPVFHNGIRLTTDEDMDLVDMVLAGKMNKEIVRLFNKNKVTAVGISGSDGMLFTGKSIEDNSHTGRVTAVNTELISAIVGKKWVPVIATTAMEENGKALNINADETALAIATAMNADALLFLSDTPGILKGTATITRMNEKSVRDAIEQKVITGGMIPKVESSIQALKNGVRNIIIGKYKEKGDLQILLEGKKGTQIVL